MTLYNGQATRIAVRPTCDVCAKEPAVVDGAARIRGKQHWAYLCINDFHTYGIGLGTGVGQVLLSDDELDEQLKETFNLSD